MATQKASNQNGRADFGAVIGRLGAGATELRLDDKDVVFSPGDAADAAFFVLKGQIKLAVFSSSGKEAIIGLCPTGQFFGEGCLIANHPVRFSDATSVGASKIVRLEKKLLVKLLHEDGEFADVFLEKLIARTRRVEDDLIDQLFNSTEKRLARILLLLANFGVEDEPPSSLPALSQATLAQMVGASRPRVSQFLNKFRDLGFIEYNGELRVHKSLLRVVLTE